jgi:hypothetical protein
VTEQPQHPEDETAGPASADGDPATAPTEVNAPGPGEATVETVVSPIPTEVATEAAAASEPSPESAAAPESAAELEPSPESAAALESPAEPEPSPSPEAAPVPEPAPTAAAPPPPPPPPPPPLEAGSAPAAVGADRPEIPVGAAFVAGFVFAMLLRRLAR